MKHLGLSLLLMAAVHEFAWMLFPGELQGDVRNVTQWGVIASLCWVLHVLARSRWISSVCAAVAVMSTTTAGCSALWLAVRFETFLGEEQCSRVMSLPLSMLSAVAALAVFWAYKGEGDERQR